MIVTSFLLALAGHTLLVDCEVVKGVVPIFLSKVVGQKFLFDGPRSLTEIDPNYKSQGNVSQDELIRYNSHAAAAYCSKQLTDLSCSECKKFKDDVVFQKVLRDDVANTLAFVTTHSKRKEIVVTFRGSFNIMNALIDLATIAIPSPRIPKGVKVHAGLYAASLFFYPKITPILDKQLATFPEYGVVITGHSLGGAMASLTTFILAQDDKLPKNPTSLITYGQPRVGNKAFVDYMNRLPIRMARVVSKADIITHVPPVTVKGTQLLGDNYLHTMREYWVEEDGKVKTCSITEYEDDHCSTSIGPGYTMTDHLEYFGVDYKLCGFTNPLELASLPVIGSPDELRIIPPFGSRFTKPLQEIFSIFPEV